MNPLYLGTGERRLFGIYEPAATKSIRSRAAVLCAPWGAEYVYAHRTLRQLAAKLSACGYHTLRFDFFGTGDSSGELSDADLGGWQTDTRTAIDEIKEISGAARVTLIGLRLGASIAARVAARDPQNVESLVLWDPIVSGEQYLQDLRGVANGGGFPLTPTMMRDLETIDLHADMAATHSRSLLLVTEANPVAWGMPLPAAEYLPAPCPWQESVTTSGAVPSRVIQRIAEWLG